MKCGKCVEAGLKSTLFDEGPGATTLMLSSSFWDEEGVYHQHNPNIASTYYRCSNGHRFSISRKRGCGAEGCDYGGKEKVIWQADNGPERATSVLPIGTLNGPW